MALLRDAYEEKSYGIKIEILDEETGLLVDDALVTQVRYSLQDRDNNFIVPLTSANDVAEQTIILTGSELDIIDPTSKKEIRYFTVEATVDGNPWGIEDNFYIINMRVK